MQKFVSIGCSCFVQLKACADVQQEVTQMIEAVGLRHKRDAQAHTLSGGMKRKLCVGIALMGNPQVSGKQNCIQARSKRDFGIPNLR